MKITACIFDLDGVVVDTAKYHYLAWRRLAQELGFHFSPVHNEQLKGVSRMRSLEILLNVGGISMSQEDMQSAAQRKNAWYVDYITGITPGEILPGVLDFIKELDRYGIRKAIGSASKNAGLILKKLEIDRMFDTLIDGTKVTKAKPDPEIFLLAAKALGCVPNECIVFEDAQAGIKAAKNGGMFCIGVGTQDVLTQADWIINSFQGISWPQILNKLNH